MENVLRVAKYKRVSHDEQALHGYSIQTQDDTLDEFCKANGYKIVGDYTDEGISGAKPPLKRPALKQLLDDVKAGKIDIIIFTKLDRWFRSIEEYYKVQAILERHNVAWRTVLEDYNTATADGRLKVNIMLSVAANERERTSERIKVVFNTRWKKGEYCLGGDITTLGYMRQTDENGLVRLVKDPATQHIMEEFWDMMIKYNNLTKTSAYLNTKYNLQYIYSKWSRIRNNELYTGEYRGNKGFCEPYISREDWLKVKSQPIKKTQKNRVYLFTGLIKCPECGRNLNSNCTVKLIKGSKFDYKSYKCPNAITKVCSHTTSVSEIKLEKYLLDNFPQLIGAEIQAANALKVKQLQIEKATPKKNIKTDVAKLKEKLRKLSVVYVDGLIDDEEYFARSAELKALIDKASQETPEVERDITHLEEVLKTDWRALYDVMDLENKRRFWRSFIKEIVIEGKDVKRVIFL